MGQSPSCTTARPTGTCPGRRSGNGRVVQLYRREKNQIYIITIVDRLTRCYLGFQVVWQRTQEAIQELVDEAPKAKHYYSDAFEAYDHLWYHWGVYEVSQGEADTYSVEADNAELRHYLARLVRRSRCPEALSAALKLFMYCFNQRQLHKQIFRITRLMSTNSSRPNLYPLPYQAKPYSWEKLANTALTYDPLQRASVRPAQSLLQAMYEAGVDYTFFDTVRGVCDKELLFYAGGHWLASNVQDKLKDYVENGGHLVMLGSYPYLEVLDMLTRKPLAFGQYVEVFVLRKNGTVISIKLRE